MTTRNQLLVVLTALMMVCSSGAMVAGAAPTATLDEHDEDEYDDSDAGEDTGTDGDDTDPENVMDEEVDPPENGDMDGVGEDAEATVTFTDQELENETVIVDEVTIEDGGFVVIHDSSLFAGNVFESVIGVSEYLNEGTHENVEVVLDEPIEEDETLIAMPHFDTNDNEEYDFVETDGVEDGPYLTADDEPVTDEAVVTVDAEPDETPEEAEEVPVEEEPVDEEPADVDPDDADEEIPEEEPETAEGEPVEEEPVDEEPAEEETEAVEEEPVEKEPVEEEPVEEEPEAVDDDAIDVLIEEVTIFVFFDELPHDKPADGDHVDVDANDVEGGDGLEGAAIDGDATETDANAADDAAHDDANGTYDLDELGYTFTDIELNVTVETVTVVPIYDHHGEEHHDADSDHHHHDADDEHHHDADNGTDGGEADSVDDAHAAADHDEYDIVIEHASVFVFVGDLGELPHHPIDEPADHDGDSDDAVDDADGADTQPAIATAL